MFNFEVSVVKAFFFCENMCKKIVFEDFFFCFLEKKSFKDWHKCQCHKVLVLKILNSIILVYTYVCYMYFFFLKRCKKKFELLMSFTISFNKMLILVLHIAKVI